MEETRTGRSLRVESGCTLLVATVVPCEAGGAMSTADPTRVDLECRPGSACRRLRCAERRGPGPGRPADARPRATRIAEGAVLGGVCTGLARHLGWPVMVIRIGFVGSAAGPVPRRHRVRGVVAADAARAGQSGARTRGGHPARDARRQAKPARRPDWGMLLALGRARHRTAVDRADQRSGDQPAAVLAGGLRLRRARLWSGGRPTPLSRSAGGPRPAARSGWRRSWPAAAGRRSSGSSSVSGWSARRSAWSSRSRTSCSSCPR